MQRFFRNIPIFRRLFFVFVFTALIPAVVLVLLGQFFINSLNTKDQAVKISADAQSLASQEQSNLQRMNALLQSLHNQVIASASGQVQDPSLKAAGSSIEGDIVFLVLDFDQALTTYQNDYELATSSNMSDIRSNLVTNDPADGPGIISDQQDALSRVQSQWNDYNQLQQQEILELHAISASPNFVTEKEYAQAYRTLWLADKSFLSLRNGWQRVVDDAVAAAKAVTTVGSADTQPVFIATTVSILLIILLTAAIAWLVNITITRPLGNLSALTRRIARGNTSARAEVSGNDEITKVASTMNNMLDNIVHLIQEVQAQRDALQSQVEKLVSEVSGVGEGDLRIQAEVTADALGVLADSFNYMVEELSSLIVRVKMVSQEVENSTTLTFERMTQLVENADIQIQQIGASAIEVEHMAGYSRQVAERAQSLYIIAREARQTAESGRESVEQAVEGMGRIHSYVQDTATKVQALAEESREIDDIVGAIANIAHQTNRLALDAAIQAAMAGENGKGFGAVAADIRRLAERAKDQANMIARIVRSVREDIGAAAVSMQDTEREASTGSKLAEEAGSSLVSIFSVVDRQGQEIETINQMAARQLQSSNTVVQIMQNVSEATQQSSSSTREAAQNMERLARLAEQLLASVEAFKLRENTDYYPTTNMTVTPESDADNYMTVSGVFRTVTASAQPAELGRYSGYPGYPGYPNQALPPGNPAVSSPGPVPAYAPASYQQNGGNNSGNGSAGFGGYNGSRQGRPQQYSPRPPEWQ